MICENKKTLLFVHNSLPEYRIKFWKELNEQYNLELLISNRELERKTYGFIMDTTGLNIVYYDDITQTVLAEMIKNSDAVVLPSADKPREAFIARRIGIMCKKNKIPYFYWNEKWEPSKIVQPFAKRVKNYIQRTMIGFASKGCDCYIASGTKSYEYLDKWKPEGSKIEIAFDSSSSPESNESIDIKKKYGIPQNANIILFLGRLVSRKGCDLLISAFVSMNNNNNTYLLICGAGEQEEALHEQASNYSNIIFCGKAQPYERRQYYEQSDLFVLPSIIEKGVVEAWGLTLNEALECGTPIISTSAVGAAYDLIDNDIGIMVPAGDVGKLRDAIESKKLWNIDRQKCISRYKEFSVEKMAIDFCKIVNGRMN